MQVLYGIRITERVRVDESFGQFVSFFDNERIGVFGSGKAAVIGAKNFLLTRAERREEEARIAAERERQTQQDDDDEFLLNLSDRLGVGVGDLERLIEIVKRRNE